MSTVHHRLDGRAIENAAPDDLKQVLTEIGDDHVDYFTSEQEPLTAEVMAGWASYGFALRARTVGEEVWGASVRFPLRPVKAMIPLGAGLLSLLFLLDAVRVLVFRAVMTRDDNAGVDTAGSAIHD